MAKTTLVISDVHLGQTASRTDHLISMLNKSQYDRLIILGDLFHEPHLDSLKDSDLRLINHIKTISKKVEVIWIEGNHDYQLADMVPDLLGAKVYKEYMWDANGKRYLAIHGDSFDGNRTDNKFVKLIADPLIYPIRAIDKKTNHLALWVETCYSVLSGMNYLTARNALKYAEEKNADYIFCGHTHLPTYKKVNTEEKDVHYYNIGTWTRSPSTYAVVDNAGNVEIKETPAL